MSPLSIALPMLRTLCASLLIWAGCAEGFAQESRLRAFKGMCDASAAEALSEDLVAVADDEQNSIRVYSRRLGGEPAYALPLSAFLKVDAKSPEADLEGAACLGDRIYWISSHGRNAKGKARPSRGQFFATTGSVKQGAIDLKPIGQSYHGLLMDLLREPKLAPMELWKAAQLPPKAPGGLNIEGLAAATNGQLLIGFRNPVPRGKALVVPLQNPSDLLALKSARLGEPLLLDLGGLGIRSMTWCRDRFLIVAGRFDEGGKSRLFEWTGGAERPHLIKGLDFNGLNPEAITCFPGNQEQLELFITSDDGTAEIDGQPCKKLKDHAKKYFHGLSMMLPNFQR